MSQSITINTDWSFAGVKKEKEEGTEEVIRGKLLDDDELYKQFQSSGSNLFTAFMFGNSTLVEGKKMAPSVATMTRELLKNSISTSLRLQPLLKLLENILTNQMPKLNADELSMRLGSTIEWKIVGKLLSQPNSYFKGTVADDACDRAIDSIKEEIFQEFGNLETLTCEETQKFFFAPWGRRFRQLKRLMKIDNLGNFEMKARSKTKPKKEREASWVKSARKMIENFEEQFTRGKRVQMDPEVAKKSLSQLIKNIVILKCQASPFKFQFNLDRILDHTIMKNQTVIVQAVLAEKQMIPIWLLMRADGKPVELKAPVLYRKKPEKKKLDTPANLPRKKHDLSFLDEKLTFPKKRKADSEAEKEPEAKRVRRSRRKSPDNKQSSVEENHAFALDDELQ